MGSITETSLSWETGGGGPWPPADRADGARMRAKVLAESGVKTKSEKGDREGNKWIVQMLFHTPLQQLLQNICNRVWLECSNLALLLYLHPHPWYEHRLERNPERQRLSSPCIFASVLRSALPWKSGICHILATLPQSLVSLLCWPLKKLGRTVIWSQASQQNWWLM